jgi:hypothetical protein
MFCAGLMLACAPGAETKPSGDDAGVDGGQQEPTDAGGMSEDAGHTTDGSMLEVRGRVTGRVFDQRTLQPIAGAQVHTPEGQVAVTDARGVFTAELATVGPTALTFHALGYARGIEPTSIAQDETTFLEAQLLPVDGMAMISSDKGGAVTGTGGASVQFSANAFKHKDGSEVKGEVIVELTALDPSSPEGLRAFPGSFSAMSKDGKEGQLITVVPMDITARQGDKVLDIAPATRAVVHFPIPNPDTAPATIALWSLSETTGEWIEEGIAEKIFDAETRSYVYRGAIQHMSWWNCDSFARITCIRGCVKTADGKPVAQARTLAEGIDFSNVGEGYTGPNGCFAEDVPAGGQLRVRVQSAQGVSAARVVTAQDAERRAKEDPSACQDLGTFIIDDMAMMEGCPAGMSACGDSCVDLGSSVGNCGACGTSCEDGASCVDGKCSCKASELACDGVCTNVRDSDSNCGACGDACGKGAECVAGSCVQVACPTGTVQCLGGCFNGTTCCGDAACDQAAGESVETCRADCGKPTVCGDGTCGNGETLANCAADCSVCGDKSCTGGETVANCATDCFLCGDNKCTGPETHRACPNDCACDGFACGDGECIAKPNAQCDGTEDCANGNDEDQCASTPCGDGTCAVDESPASCPADCVGCGDGTCGAAETAQNCPSDCFSCGDGTCNGAETPSTCGVDCVGCGDGKCGGAETAQTCDADCSRCGDDHCSASEKAQYDFFGTCAEDCGSCGDTYCTLEEYYDEDCAADCGTCGDNECSDAEWLYEDCSSDCNYEGQGEVGDFCWENDECRTGLACRDDVCAEPGLDGEVCDDDDDDAEECSAGLACLDGTCGERGTLGELCYERSDCQSALVCKDEQCAAPAQLGEACDSPMSGSEGLCAAGLVCVASPDIEDGYKVQCEDPSVPGSPCNWDGHCTASRTCLAVDDSIMGICRDRGTLGMSCADANDCVPGLGCFADKCVAGAQAGDLCDVEVDYSSEEDVAGSEGDDTDCADGLVCVRFRDAETASCAVLGQPGAQCGEYADCASDAICVYGTALKGTCRATEGEVGDVCDFGYDCAYDLVCVHEVTGGTCAEPGAIGDACDDEDDCQYSLACFAHECAARSATGGTCDMLPWHPWSAGDESYEYTYPSDGSGRLYGDHSDCVDGDECWQGTCVAEGELGYSCYENEECSSGLVCRDNHCQPLGQAGAECDWQEDADCAASLLCDDGLCATAGGIHASCYGSDPCDSGLVCKDDRCGAPAQLGELCEPWWWTPSGYNTGCAAGLACVDSLCAVAGSLGAPCSDTNSCLDGLVCSTYNDECALPAAEGEYCWDVPCAQGLVCDQYSDTCTTPAALGESCESLACGAGLACDFDSEVCMWAANAGDACGSASNAACLEGLECLSGTCVQDGILGTSCYGSYDDECATGLSCGYDYTCRTTPGMGDSCELAPCSDALTCHRQSELCVTPSALGEDCTDVACHDDLSCAWDDSTEGSFCRAKAQQGESCADVSCADHLRCEFDSQLEDQVCTPSHFQCGDGSWIPVYWVCDNYDDCDNGEDEQDCSFPQFTCKDGSTISLDWKCDGMDDCATGEDELDCGATVPGFTCNDATVIAAEQRCDGTEQCATGEDELGCLSEGR